MFCFVFSEFPGPVFWCLSLILESSQPLLLQRFCLDFLIWRYPICMLQVFFLLFLVPFFWDDLRFYFVLFPPLFFSLHFSSGLFHWPTFRFTDSKRNSVKSVDEIVKGLLCFCVTSFIIYVTVLFVSSTSFDF